MKEVDIEDEKNWDEPEYDMPSSINRLKDLITNGSRVAFYPSSGTTVEAFDFSRLPLDYIICSDFNIEEKQLGKIITFKGDNNLCLRVIIESGIKLDAIFAIQDGAIEGGNHEYVNSIGFLGKALPALNNAFVLVSNMSDYFSFERGPIKHVRCKGLRAYRQATYSTYDTNVNNYDIKCFKINDNTSHTIHVSENKTINILRKSIWQDQNKLDGIFKGTKDRNTGKKRESLKKYWPIDYMEDILFDIFDLTLEASILPLLEFANNKKLVNIGLVPFMAGRYREHGYSRIVKKGYQQFVEDFKNWDKLYPKQINLYHFDKGDFKELYLL